MAGKRRRSTARASKAARPVAQKKRAAPWPEWITFVEWQASEMLAVVDLVSRLRQAEVIAGAGVEIPGFVSKQAAPLFDDEGLEQGGVRFASSGGASRDGGTLHADVRRAFFSPEQIAKNLKPAAIRKLREEWEVRLREWGHGLYDQFADKIRARNIKRVAERRVAFMKKHGSASMATVWSELASELSLDGGERSIRRAMQSDKAQGGITSVDPRILHYSPSVPPPPDMSVDPFDPDQDRKRKKLS